jgi:biotin carboxyl carrier protein
MKYEVTLDGHTRTVALRRQAGQLQAQIDDGSWVDVASSTRGPTARSVTLGEARSHLDVAVDGETAFVLQDGRAHRGTVVDPRDHALDLGAGGDAGTLVSQMPGAVVRVLVEAGQAVAEGDILVVVEAMKMENEFKAPFAGVVSEVAVSAGTSIEAGATLVVVEPSEAG